jgi:hypothetical protein
MDVKQNAPKVWRGYTSSRIMDAKSWCVFVFFCVLGVFCLIAGLLYMISALQLSCTSY